MNALIKTPAEINIMRESGKILATVLTELQNTAKAGMSTLELDQLAEKLILEHNATPSFKGVPGPVPYPASICVAIDNQAVHGIPNSTTILKDGQILTIDIGVYYNGFHTDSATTFGIGEISPSALQFIESCRETLYQAIDMVKPGVKTGTIGNFIEQKTHQDGYKVLRDLIGHGIGRNLHEPPQIPNFGKKGQGTALMPGMTICIEPIIAQFTRFIEDTEDQWTLITRDGSLACQQEHTILVTSTGYEILTLRTNEKISKSSISTT